MLKRLVLAVIVLVIAVAAAAAGWWIWPREQTQAAERPDIPFAPLVDERLKDPDNPTKVFRVDFARIEHDVPLSRSDRARLTPANLQTLQQEEVDQIYARLTAGPIPDGAYRGDLFFSRGESMRPRLEEILGGIGGRIAAEKIELLERVGRTLWKGKLFDREQMVLRTSSRTSADGAADRRSFGADDCRDAARRLPRSVSAHDQRLAPVPGQALLRPEPARRAPGVGDRRLSVRRRDPGLPGEPGQSRRAGRAAHPR